MKTTLKFGLLFLVSLSNAGAAEANQVLCINPDAPELQYSVKRISQKGYLFSIKETTVSDESRRSRWGGDEVTETIYTERMSHRSKDGPQYVTEIYQGSQSRLVIEDDQAFYSYSFVNRTGQRVKRTVELECRI